MVTAIATLSDFAFAVMGRQAVSRAGFYASGLPHVLRFSISESCGMSPSQSSGRGFVARIGRRAMLIVCKGSCLRSCLSRKDGKSELSAHSRANDLGHVDIDISFGKNNDTTQLWCF